MDNSSNNNSNLPRHLRTRKTAEQQENAKIVASSVRESKKADDEKTIQGFRFIDDEFMKAAFPDNIPAAQSIIDAIFGENKYTVIDVKCQVEVSPLRNRGVRLDILMRDLAGRRFNVEFQRDEMPADPHRARLNASLLDSNIMRKGEKPQGMPDRYVIFITETTGMQAGPSMCSGAWKKNCTFLLVMAAILFMLMAHIQEKILSETWCMTFANLILQK